MNLLEAKARKEAHEYINQSIQEQSPMWIEQGIEQGIE
ncbi:MAG: hypothetical protein K0R12_1105 [Gammaproteobacteria bacterium]|jgi:hypothetical protein|nr:hypothetical protein [Gammaproteobacteria bacterium]